MKTTIVISFILGGLFIGLILLQNSTINQQKKFVDDCVAQNGIYSDSQYGWMHKMLICKTDK